jgi:predicted deacylase
VSTSRSSEPLTIGGEVVGPGERVRLDLPVARLPTHTPLHLPVTVVNGERAGPRLWLSAAVHGDELNGVEIIRQVLAELDVGRMRGTLLAVHVVNVFGFIQQRRYLPDRRDLNRSFPGSPHGSLASRLAHLLMTEIVAHCTHGIDLHTASAERSNLPQIRADLEDLETRRIAEAFRAPVMLHSTVRDGSLRQAATRRGIPVLLFEGGEPLRFNDAVIAMGVAGVRRVMAELGMIRRKETRKTPRASIVLRSSSWVRARRGGLLRLQVGEGDSVEARQVIGLIADPFGDEEVPVRATVSGLVIGKTNNPVVHMGDGIVHIGRL